MSVTALADVPLFRQLGAAQGLPSEHVHALAQDQHDCLWVGTTDGLARYDGTRFEVWHHDPRRSDSLPSNRVQTLHRDGRGRLWAGFEGGGLGEVREHGERVWRWRGADGEDAELDVWAIGSDAQDRIYFGGFGTGLVRINPETGERRVWRSDDGLLSEHILALHSDPEGLLWVASHGGLQRLREDRLETPGADEGAPAPGAVFSLGVDQGELWMGSREGAFRRRSGQFEQVSSGAVLALARDAEGALWLGRPAGLDMLPLDGVLRPAFGAPQRARQRSVMAVIRDHEEGIWVGSDGAGLFHLPPRWRRFRSWSQAAGGLSTATPVAAAFSADGSMWVGGSDGRIDRLDAASGEGQLRFELPADWPVRHVSALLEHDGTLWIGTRQGLLRQSLEAGAAPRRFLPGASDPDAPPVGVVDHLLAAPDGSVWLSIYGGGIEHRQASGALLRRYTEAEGLAGLDSEQLRFGPDGQLWVAGGDGLQRLDPDSGRLVSLASLRGERVFGFVFDADGGLWVSRRSGLLYLRQQDGNWLPGALTSLLVGIEAGGLSIDGGGRLWASSARGLWRIDPQRGTTRRFGVRDGLPGQEFSDRPLAESSAPDVLAAVLPQALLRIDGTLFDGEAQTPALRLEPLSLRRDGAALSLPASQAVALRHDDREIGFALRVSSFIEPDAWRYRMRLEPFDADWVALDASGQRIFPLLPAGDYRLRMAAAGPEGEWHEQPPIALSVAPPWWALPWARALQLGLLLAILIGLYWLHRRRLAARAAVALAESQRRWALQASEQKSQFLATLAHEIRTPMTGLLGMAELLANSELDPQQRHRLAAVQQSGALLRRLVDDALDLARIEAGRLEIRTRPTALPALCRQVIDGIAVSAEAKGLRIDCVLDPHTPAWVMVDPERLQQILLNLLGNAIKFSERGTVRLTLSAEDAPRLRFEVEDSGPGIAPAQRKRLLRRYEQAEGEVTARRHGGAGLGLAICSELATAMGGSLDLDGGAQGGTLARLTLPLTACAPVRELADQLPSASLEREASLACASPTGQHLLLVEDDPLAAEAIAGLLRQLGHRPQHAAHALAALSEAALATFDAALVDLDLPGMDGLQLAGLLRTQRPELRLIALTARSDAGLAQKLQQAGFFGLLRKPVSAAELHAALGGGPAEA